MSAVSQEQEPTRFLVAAVSNKSRVLAYAKFLPRRRRNRVAAEYESSEVPVSVYARRCVVPFEKREKRNWSISSLARSGERDVTGVQFPWRISTKMPSWAHPEGRRPEARRRRIAVRLKATSQRRKIKSRGTISLATGRRGVRVVDSSRTTGWPQSGKDTCTVIKADDSADTTIGPVSTYTGRAPRKRPGTTALPLSLFVSREVVRSFSSAGRLASRHSLWWKRIARIIAVYIRALATALPRSITA